MLFLPPSNDINLVIVPPKPDASLLQQDEFSYCNLYSYGASEPSLVASDISLSASSWNPAAASPIRDVATPSSPRPVKIFPACHEAPNISDNGTIGTSINDIDNNNDRKHSINSLILQRDPRNGAFTFQVHAEYDLLLHVQKDLDRYHHKVGRGALSSSLGATSDVKEELEPARIIMKSVDTYCLGKQWMYHIGYEKAVAVSNFLQCSLLDFINRHSNELSSGHVKKFTCVELGTYCGYSALVLCHAIRSTLMELEAHEDARAKNVEFAVFTTEISSKLINVAQSVFRLGKVDTFVRPILVKEGDVLSEVIKGHLNKDMDGMENIVTSIATTQIDFLLLDHAKNLYLPDLIDLENHQLLAAGSYVSADNVVFNRLDSYRNHMAMLAREGIVETRLEEMNLEYSNNLKDGIGEFSFRCC
jgi:catechol O-methyltransferase